MRELRTILVDDERMGRTRLRRLLATAPDLHLLEECANGAEAVEAIRRHRPDLVFLDIQMPGMDGFDVLEALTPEEQPSVVIFVTAYDAHAVRAFEACALDYILKPTSAERLAQALDRAREQVRLIGATPPPQSSEIDQNQPFRFMVRTGGRVAFIHPDEIDWIEAAGNYAILHSGARQHMLRETMGSLETQLQDRGFFRVSRSGIVNLSVVLELISSRDGKHSLLLQSGRSVPVTRPRREIAKRLRELSA